jgi:serine protease Do
MRISTRFSAFLGLLIVLVSVTLLSMRGTGATLPVAAAAAPKSSVIGRTDSPPTVMDVNLFRNIARQVNPVVVAIMTRSRADASPSQEDELFRRFFGLPGSGPGSRVQRGLGSGFLISEQGDILTNNHVVAGADVIEVALFGDENNTQRARLIGRDPLSDSALIRLEHAPRGLPVATLGDSDAIEPGDWVMAIGNPFQLGHTVTVGVVSYLGRPFEVQEGRWQKMIQTDASINPGNSGGPLLNVKGDVVGINAAILGAGSGGNIGIGFAVPINSVKKLLPQLQTGKVVHGRIGIQVRNGPISEDEAKALGLPKREGAIVTGVERGSPADRAGLKAGDVIVGFNGAPVPDGDDLVPRVSSTAPGSQVAVTVLRDGRERTFDVTVEELAQEDEGGAQGRRSNTSNFGLQLGDITPSVARELQLPSRIKGAVVYSVEPDSDAARAGLMEGDVVLSVNRHPVQSAIDATQQLRRIDLGQPAFLLVWRDGNEILVQIRRES